MNTTDKKHLFDSYPEQHEFFVASDDTAFLQKHHAEAYVNDRAMSNKHIRTITREEVENEIATEAKPATKAKVSEKAAVPTPATTEVPEPAPAQSDEETEAEPAPKPAPKPAAKPATKKK